MKRLFALLLMALALGAAGAKEAAPLAEDPAVEQRLVAISEEMRCLVCQNESLSASRSDLAQDLRRELRTLIKQGKTDAEIREFMVSRYPPYAIFLREASSEIYGPRVYFLSYKNPKIPFCNFSFFILFCIFARSVYQISYNLIYLNTEEGLTTPLTRWVASICYLCVGVVYIVLLGSPTGLITLVS
jgi:hypothetical protein